MSGRRLIAPAIFAGVALAIALAIEAAVWRRPSLTLPGGVVLLAPRWLGLAALLPLLAWAARGSLTDLAWAQRALSLGVRSLLVLALAGALARPSRLDHKHEVTLVALVDASDSVSDRQLDDARRFMGELRAARGANRLELISFAGRPRRIELPADPRAALPDLRPRAAADPGDATDAQGALELAHGLFPDDTLRRAVLVSDGNQTRGDLLGAAAAARRSGVELSTRAFAAEHEDEVLVRELELPAEVRIGQPFEARAEIYASRAVTADVTLWQGEFVDALDGRRRVALEPGRNLLRWKSEVHEPGFVAYRVEVTGLPRDFRDRFPENDRAVASLAVRGKPRVLYIEGEPAAAHFLQRALEAEQLEVDVRGAYGLPSSARDLDRWDLVILSDVPASLLGLSQMTALEGYVRDGGGGFIMAGGENSFGSGGWGGTTLEKLLPVRFDVEKKRDQPQLALALAIDRSGSMQGEKLELAKDAARQSAELLGADDQIAVIAFDAQAQPVVRLQRAANRLRIGNDIARLTAGGGTNLLAPLREAYQELQPARAKVKHVILLTDGQASYDGIGELVEEMAASKITVSAVGVGAGADKTLLAMIAERGGGRFYFTEGAQNIPKIFTKETTEVARAALVEEPVRARIAKHAELLDGTGIEGAPPLRGYVATKPKPLAETILASDLGEPILARWRVGLGQSVAWTSDVKNRWAADWVRWPGYGKFFAQLVRSAMRHRALAGESGYTLHTEVDPPLARVTVDAVGADDRFVDGLTTRLEVLTPGPPGARPPPPIARAPMREVAPGRYEGELTLDRYGSFALRAVHEQDGRTLSETTGALSLPYPREYLALPPDQPLLRRAAEVGGGSPAPSPAWLFDPRGGSIEFHRDLWPLCLWAAIALLLLDVFLRRVRLFGYR